MITTPMFRRYVLGIVGSLALLAVIIIGGWQAGWWFTYANANRQLKLQNINAHNIRAGYSNQQSLRDQITQDIAAINTMTTQIAFATLNVQVNAIKVQRESEAGTVCQDMSEITGDPLPAQQQTWDSTNCITGVVRSSSPFYVIGTP